MRDAPGTPAASQARRQAPYIDLIGTPLCSKPSAGGPSSHEPIADIIKTVAAGQSIPNFAMDMLHEMNAKHANDFGNCTKAETIDLHKKGVDAAAAVVRGLSDDQLAKSGTVLTEAPPMTAEQVITGHPHQPH